MSGLEKIRPTPRVSCLSWCNGGASPCSNNAKWNGIVGGNHGHICLELVQAVWIDTCFGVALTTLPTEPKDLPVLPVPWAVQIREKYHLPMPVYSVSQKLLWEELSAQHNTFSKPQSCKISILLGWPKYSEKIKKSGQQAPSTRFFVN